MSAPLKYVAIISFIIISGCGGDKPEHANARHLMGQFTCPTANGIWANFLKDSKDRAQIFLDNYEKGMHLINLPIDQVIQMQLNEFKEACDSSNKNRPFP